MDGNGVVKTVTTENGTIKKVEETPQLLFISAAELNEKNIDPPKFIIEGMLSEGLALLVAPSKACKSWMALDMGISVATGTKFLGRMTNKGSVLYIAYEDSEFRLKDRQEKVLNGRPAPKDLYLATAATAADLDHGLIEQLESFLTQKPDTNLVIIDTFQCARSLNNSKNAYAKDYKDVGKFKAFADAHRLTVLLVHHTSKRTDDNDPFASINGTTGIMGASDTTIMLTRTNKETGLATMNITGRDVPQDEFKLKFDWQKFRWQMEGSSVQVAERLETEAYERNPIVKTIRKLMHNNPDGWTGTASEILSASQYYTTPINETAQKLGKSIKAIQDQLYERDNIHYGTIENGTGSKKHRFYYGYNPFEEA